MTYSKLVLLPLLALLVLSSCKRDPLTDEIRERLLDKTWTIESLTMRVDRDTVIGMEYDGDIGLVKVSYERNGAIFQRDTLENYFEEWEFDAGRVYSGFEELRQLILPFLSDSTCHPMVPDSDPLFCAWQPLEGNDPGKFMEFSVALPVPFAGPDAVNQADTYIFLRGEVTWLNDSTFVLEDIDNDPAQPNSPYTFRIRLRHVQASGCQNPDFCGNFLRECDHGTYKWDRCDCECEEGWRGYRCDEEVCENPPSCVNGTPVANGTRCECECEAGWTGYFCNEPVPTGIDCDTSTVPCVNGTLRASEDSTRCECQCYPGWEGPDCSQTLMKAISTIAGNGTAGFANGTGSNATFNEPRGMVTDAQYNIYVADAANNVIRKVTPAGVVTTFAGTGVAGYHDGPADSAMFHNPSDITRDLQGNFYVADHFNHVIRKITPDGTVSTIAGTGSPGTTNGDLLTAAFSNPFALVWDEYFLLGNQVLLVADRGTNIIRKVDLETGMVSNFAGQFSPIGGNINGAAASSAFRQVTGMSFSSEGALFVADRGNDAVRKITITNGQADQVWTFAGKQPNGNVIGLAANDPLNKPSDVLWQFPNLIYVTDGDNHRIRVIEEGDFPFGFTRDVAGSLQNQSGFVDGTGSDARFYLPFGLCMDYDNVIYVSESGNSTIRKLE